MNRRATTDRTGRTTGWGVTSVDSRRKAGDGIRTHDIHLGKVAGWVCSGSFVRVENFFPVDDFSLAAHPAVKHAVQMTQEQRSIECSQCGRPTLHARARFSESMGCLLTILTFGLFLPVWLILIFAAETSPFRCQACGQVNRSR